VTRARGGGLVCPFHGFEFGADGRCNHIPELGRGSARIGVATLPAREAHGFVWLWWGLQGQPPDEALPWFDDLGDEAGYRRFGLDELWPTHYTRSVENQLDYAHLPYVHRSSIGRFVREPMRVQMETDERRIFWFDEARREAGPEPRGEGGGQSFIEFHFPNVWQNRISPSFALSLAFVPVDAEHTLLLLTSHLRSAAAQLPVLGTMVGALTTALNRWILSQDRQVVLSQQPIDSLQASDEVLVGSDQAIRHFRKQLQASGLCFAEVCGTGVKGPGSSGQEQEGV
jgi:phenylpropionate dioxygenase-like ring-hydroxylating dioxygenase large terminal subunit